MALASWWLAGLAMAPLLEAYRRQGFIDSTDEHESVSKTLEYAYDDFAIAALARSLGRGEVADEFDSIHTIQRAQRVGSVDAIIPAESIRPWIIEALERGMAAYGA